MNNFHFWISLLGLKEISSIPIILIGYDSTKEVTNIDFINKQMKISTYFQPFFKCSAGANIFYFGSEKNDTKNNNKVINDSFDKLNEFLQLICKYIME